MFDKNILDKLEAEDDSRVGLSHRICEMQREIQAMGSSMLVIHGDLERHRTTRHVGQPTRVHTHEDYEPYGKRCVRSQTLTPRGIEWHTYTDHVIQAPGEVTKPDGTPYRLHPFSKRWHLNLTDANMAQAHPKHT